MSRANAPLSEAWQQCRHVQPRFLGTVKIELILDGFQGTSDAFLYNGEDTVRASERTALMPTARIL
jgi:hypothetical protein